jgi:CTD small phosphatase-like protein 2
MVRPYCNRFLSELSNYYEIVIFTAAMQDYADWIINGIDNRKNISHRLYR